MFAEAIADILDRGLSRRELATLAHCDESAVGRWATGETVPMLATVCVLLDNLRGDGRHAEAELLIAVIDRRAHRAADTPDLDINHDGKVGAADAIAGCVQVVVSAAGAMKENEASCRDGRLSETELTSLLHTLAVVEECSRHTRAAVQITYEQGRLRPARRVTHPGLNGQVRP